MFRKSTDKTGLRFTNELRQSRKYFLSHGMVSNEKKKYIKKSIYKYFEFHGHI